MPAGTLPAMAAAYASWRYAAFATVAPASHGELLGDRLAGALGLEHDELAGALEDLAQQPVGAGVGDLDHDGAVGELLDTVCSSRAQRARSGETQTRATSAAGTLAVSQPPSIAAISSTSGRGSKLSCEISASLIRSSRKWRTSSRRRS